MEHFHFFLLAILSLCPVCGMTMEGFPWALSHLFRSLPYIQKYVNGNIQQKCSNVLYDVINVFECTRLCMNINTKENDDGIHCYFIVQYNTMSNGNCELCISNETGEIQDTANLASNTSFKVYVPKFIPGKISNNKPV